MAPSPAHIASMTAKAVATLARTDGIAVASDAVEFVQFDGRNSGQYLIVRDGDEVLAIYKVQVRPGPARAERQADGGVIYMVNSLSIGLKRIKRPPKGLLP
jgi:hypothetical protein